MPPNDLERTALVAVLHMMDPPRSEAAMAAALPLGGVPAWRAYLGLPMFGARMPAGGPEEFMRAASEEPLMNVLAPVIEQAAAELPAAIDELRTEFGADHAPVALVGGSAGAAAVLLSLAETDVPASAVAVVNPAVRAAAVIAAGERIYGAPYAWTEETRAKADSLDFVLRAGDIAARDPQPPILIVQGDDDFEAQVAAARELHGALRAFYRSAEDVEHVRMPGLAHPLAEEPGIEPAPQTEGAARVDAAITEWLRRRLA